MLLQIARVRLAAHVLDDAPKQVVVGVCVREAARRLARLGARERLRLGVVVAKATRLVEQVAHGDAVREAARVAQAGGRRRVEAHAALLDELHDAHGRERLAERADEHGRARVGDVAQRALVDGAGRVDHGHGHAGQARLGEGTVEVGVEPRVKCLVGGGDGGVDVLEARLVEAVGGLVGGVWGGVRAVCRGTVLVGGIGVRGLRRRVPLELDGALVERAQQGGGHGKHEHDGKRRHQGTPVSPAPRPSPSSVSRHAIAPAHTVPLSRFLPDDLSHRTQNDRSPGRKRDGEEVDGAVRRMPVRRASPFAARQKSYPNRTQHIDPDRPRRYGIRKLS